MTPMRGWPVAIAIALAVMRWGGKGNVRPRPPLSPPLPPPLIRFGHYWTPSGEYWCAPRDAPFRMSGGLSASLWAEAVSHVRPHFCRRRSGPTWEKGNVRTKAFSSFPLQTPAPCLADVAGCRRMNGKVVRSIFERAPMAVVGPNAARRPYQSAIRPQVRPESWGEDAEPSPSPMPSRARARGSARGRGRARGRARAAWWRWW